jgi:hypothetical protein
MSAAIEKPAMPYWLCQYCEVVTRQLIAIIKKGVKHDFMVDHYPNLQALIDGILERRCHLCAVFIGGIAALHGLRTIERVLEKLDEYHDKATRPLLMNVSVTFGDDLNRGDPTCLGLNKWNPIAEPVSILKLRHNKRGTDKRYMLPELLSAFTGSDQSFALIKRWLRICSTEHPECCINSKQFKPTRLLDLGTRDADEIKLIAGSTTGHAPYAALSYCWGTVPQLKLSSKNHSEFERRIPFESLSRVAQDATTVCRAMSVRYLWIDAICIMQGSDGDFHQEAARMEGVYASALFTICAGASADTTQPFLSHRDPLGSTQCHLIDEKGESLGYMCANYCDRDNDVPGKFDLDSRGWCFQELFLSPRSIYFGPKGVHWMCREGTVCDRYPGFERLGGIKNHWSLDRESPKQLYKKVVSLGHDISEPETNLELCTVWKDIRGDYSLKQLSYQSDKLLALAGVASVLQKKFNVRASFGLWLEVFHQELLWIVIPTTSRNKGTRRLDIAPSWSWANLDNCEIRSLVGYDPDTGHRLLNFNLATIISLPPVTNFAIPLQESGYEYNISIRLVGRITACVLRKRELYPKDYPSRPTQLECNYYADTVLEAKDLYCFLVKRVFRVAVDSASRENPNRGQIEDKCLVLTSVSGSDHRFRRVGVYYERSSWYRHDGGAPSIHSYMFHGEQEEQEIEII